MNRLKPSLPFFMGAGLFVSAFITYLLTLCPSNYFGDSGELISMMTVLGVPHPTGFPLYILAGKISLLFPFGSAAFRVNLLSAFFGALVPALLFFAMRFYALKDKNDFTSLYLPFAAALLFIFSYTLWSQAVVARIYTMNAFLCALALALFLYHTEVTSSKKALYLLSFVTGLGSGLHLSAIVFSGLLWIYLLLKDRKTVQKMALPLVFFAMAGASACFYIFIRGSSDVILKWVDLHSLADFKNYFTQAQYKSKMFTRDAAGYAHFFGFMWGVIVKELSIAGFLAFLAGAVLAVKDKFKYAWLFLLIFFSNILTLSVYGNYTDLPLSFRYMIPSYMAALFFIYHFVSSVCSGIRNRTAAAAVAAGFFALILIACFPANRHENDRSLNYIAYNYPFDLLSPMESKPAFFTNGDNQIYTLAYAKFVQGRFRDVTVYDQIDTIFRDIRKLWDYDTALHSVQSGIITAFTKKISPVYTTMLPGSQSIGNSSSGLVYRLYDGPAAGGDNFLPWRLYSLKGILRGPATFHAFEEREVVSSYYYRMAQYMQKKGKKEIYAYLLHKAAETGRDSASSLGNIAIIWSNDYETPGAPQKADELFSRAFTVDPKNELLFFNAGSFFARIQLWEKAGEMFKRSSELNPGNMMAKLYLSRVMEEIEKKNSRENLLKEQSIHYENGKKHLEKKEYELAMVEFSQDIEINPTYDRSYFHIGLIHSLREEYEKAIPFYERAAEYNILSFAALNNLGLCYMKLNNMPMAKEAFKKSLGLNPDQPRIKKLLEYMK